MNNQKCPKERCLFLHREAEIGDVVTVKDKTTQRVHVRVTRDNVIDFCVGLGAQAILDYEKWLDARDDEEEDFEQFDFEIEGIISAEDVLENIKQEFKKKNGISIKEWRKKEIDKKQKKEKMIKKKKKKTKKAKKKKKTKKVIGKW